MAVQSKNGTHPVPSPEELAQVARERDAWLNKVMEMLLPPRVFSRAQQTSTQKWTQKWMEKNQITIAVDGLKIAVLREGKVFASWEPGQKAVEPDERK